MASAQGELSSKSSAFHDLSAKTTPVVALVGCDDAHAMISSRLGENGLISFASLSVKKLEDLLREKTTKASDVHASNKCFDLKDLRAYVSLPAVIAFCFELTNHSVRSVEGDVVELDSSLLRQIDEIRSSNLLKKNLKLVIIGLDRTPIQNKKWKELKSHSDVKQMIFFESDMENSLRRLEKILIESAKDYFEQKRDRAKKSAETLKKLSPNQHILAELKIAFMGEALRDISCAVKYFVNAYQSVCKLDAEAKQRAEVTTIAEFLSIKLCSVLLEAPFEDAFAQTLQQFEFHIRHFKPIVLHSEFIPAGEQLSWLARQYELFGELLTKFERFDLAHQPWHYFETAASYLVKKRQAIRSKPNQENNDPRSPGTMGSPSGREREAAQRTAISNSALALLTKAYGQAKQQACSQRTIWQLVSRMGDEYLVLRQYAKAKQMFDRILSSYMKEGYNWWALFTSVARKSMLCATKLQQTEDVVKKSFLLLPAASQLDDVERQRVMENVLAILTHSHSSLPRLTEPVLYEAEPEDALLPCRILLLTNIPKLQVNVLITSRLPLPLEFTQVRLLHQENQSIKLVSSTRPAHPLVLQPGTTRSFKFSFEVNAISDLQELRIVLEVGDCLRVVWQPSEWPREQIGSTTYIEEEAVMVEIPSAEFTIHGDEDEDEHSGPPVLGMPKRKPLTREKSNFTLRLGNHLVPLYRNRTLLGGLTDTQAKRLKEGLDLIVHEEETIELGTFMVPNSSAPLSGSVVIDETAKSVSSASVFSNMEVLQDVLNALAGRQHLTTLILSNSFLSEKMLSRFVPALARCAPQLQEVDFSNAHLHADGLSIVAGLLQSLKDLRIYRLASNKGLGDEGARIIGSRLRSAIAMRTLDLSIIDVGPAGAAALCSAVAAHPSLTELKLACNAVGEEGCKAFAELISSNAILQSIDLRANAIPLGGARYLAGVLRQNTSLRVLNLRDNDISKQGHKLLSEAMRNQYSLLELTDDKELMVPLLSRNKDLQKAIALRSSSVRLSDRAMFGIPSGLLQLANITELDVRGNRIESLPRELTNLRNLEELALSNNALTSVALNWAVFQKLKHLDISENQLIELPMELSALSGLQRLYTRKNHLVSLPASLCSLPHLLMLDLSYNTIASLPEEVGKLSTLKALNVEGNQLSALPAGLLPLQFSLEHLNLRSNLLNMLPPELALFRSQGAKVLFDANPLTQLPPEVVRRGEDAVLSYLSDLLSGGEKCTRMKLMVVGQENVGKTTLLKVLRQGASVRNKFVSMLTGKGVRSATEGIDIEDWSPAEGLTLSAWDFGGQEVYYNTHEFFLSQRSVFLLIFNMAESLETSRLTGWLNSIQSRAPGAPVILVGTNADNKACTKAHITAVQNILQQTINRWRLALEREKAIVIDQQGFDGCWFQQVSCIKGTGFDALEKKIIETALKQPCMQEKIPKVYLRLLEMVKQYRSTAKCPLLTWKELRDWNVIADDEKLRRAAQLLHDWGELLYFSDSPQLRNLVILNPQWLTKFLATVVTHKREGQQNAYVISKDTLPQLWREYPPAFYSALEDLLVKFEVWAPVHGTDTFLVPCLFPKEANTDAWLSESKDMLGRVYTMPFAPRGFFPRFLTRVLRFCSAKKYWTNGAVVAASYDRSNQAQLELRNQKTDNNPYQCTLQILVKGPSSGKLLRQLVFTMQGFLQDWYGGLRGKVDVAILCPNCIHLSATSRAGNKVRAFNMENFLGKYLDGKPGNDTLSCEHCKVNIPVRSLLPEVIEGLDSGDYATQVKEVKLLGSGSYAHVMKAVWNGREVAVKKMRTENISVEMFEEFCHEMSLMRHLDHPNIVKYYTSFAQPVALVLELVPHGALDDVLKAMTGPPNWPLLAMVALDIAKGMMYLHTHDPAILHRDLKSANILVAELTANTCHVKIADLGLSCLHTGHAGRVVDNPRWLAPETLANSVYTDKSDIFSFGMVLWELVGRALPFDDAKWDHEVEERIKHGVRPIIPADTREEYAALMKLCWDQEPARRPAFGTIVLKLTMFERAVAAPRV